jgi:hypothetical protein
MADKSRASDAMTQPRITALSLKNGYPSGSRNNPQAGDGSRAGVPERTSLNVTRASIKSIRPRFKGAAKHGNAVGFANYRLMKLSHLKFGLAPFSDSVHSFGGLARGLRIAVVALSLVSIAAVCVSKGGDVEFVQDTTLVNKDLTLVIEATRASIEIFKGEPGTVITQVEAGNRTKVVHRVRPGTFVPTSRLLIETFIPVKYAPRSRAIVRLWIPDGTELEVNGDDVFVEISGPLAGTIAVNGVITLTEGDATLTDVVGNFSITTGLGGITLNHVEGEFDAETERGSIFFRGAPTPDEISRLETGAGSIYADVIKVSDPAVSATAARGVILLHDGKRPLSGTDISVSPTDGAASLELVTANGIIDIRR